MRDDEVAVALAFAIGHDFPAAAHCRRILSEEVELALPEIDIVIGQASLLNPKVVDEAVREQRRRRREEEKARRRAHRAKADVERSSPRSKAEKRTPPPPSRVTTESVAASVVMSRRVPLLTPAEAALYDPQHPLAGWVVTTHVPFDSVDPVIPEQQSKVRPAVVVAASDDGLLVRGIYSHPSPTRSIFSPWRRLGLDHVSYVDVARSPVDVDVEVNRLGALSDEEWNALL